MFDKDQNKILQEIADSLCKLNQILGKILQEIEEEEKPTKLEIEWKGAIIMSTGTVALNLSPTAKAVGIVSELNSDGSVFQYNPVNIEAVAQDTTVVLVQVDPATGNVSVTPLKVGSTTVAVQDAATNLSASYTFTVTQTGPTPTSLSVSWSVTP